MYSGYEERLSFAISVPFEAEQVRLPKLILQPLVENTVKHGYTDNARHPHHHSGYLRKGRPAHGKAPDHRQAAGDLS